MNYINRLWGRISLTFVGSVVFIIFVPMALSITFGVTRQAINLEARIFTRSSDKGKDDNEPPFMSDETFDENPTQAITTSILRFLTVATIFGSIVGVITARGITAPLDNLAQAAKAIAAHDLGSRVEVRGSTEIKAVAQSFNEMAAALEQAETLRSNLLADVAHELRTPLAVIQGNLRAILDDVYELDKAEIARLYDQTRHLSRLVNDLHELAQAEANQLHLDLTGLDLGILATEIAAIYEPIAQSANTELRTRISEGLPIIQGDRARLTQCLQNLLNNAMQHTPSGGIVTVTLEADSETLKLSVADTGVGIPPGHLPRVFARFYRVDPARTREIGSAGLGLAITRAIIESHGGEILVESEGEGKGSIFSVCLPVG